MQTHFWQERLIETTVNYTLEIEGRLVVVENVPVRVDAVTGERRFAPETVEHLQEIIRKTSTPQRIIQVPVYEFA